MIAQEKNRIDSKFHLEKPEVGDLLHILYVKDLFSRELSFEKRGDRELVFKVALASIVADCFHNAYEYLLSSDYKKIVDLEQLTPFDELELLLIALEQLQKKKKIQIESDETQRFICELNQFTDKCKK